MYNSNSVTTGCQYRSQRQSKKKKNVRRRGLIYSVCIWWALGVIKKRSTSRERFTVLHDPPRSLVGNKNLYVLSFRNTFKKH